MFKGNETTVDTNTEEVLDTDLEKNNQEEVEEKRNQLEIQQKLAQYAHDLHDGEACPLCGSAEHPHIIEVEDVSNNLLLLKNLYTDNRQCAHFYEKPVQNKSNN